MNVGPAVSSRLTLRRFFARTDFVTSKTSISRRSRPGSAAPFKNSRPDRLVFMLSTLSTSHAERGAHGLPRSWAIRKRTDFLRSEPIVADAWIGHPLFDS